MKLSKVATAVLMLIALLVPLNAFSQQKVIWQMSELQPKIEQGGRANTIAIHPQNSNEMLVASDSGGLFKSIDSGRHWTHVDSLPVIFTQSVAYLPWNPQVIFVSAKTDFKRINGGGLWRSADSGVTWQHLDLHDPDIGGPLSAYGISVLNDKVVVGTKYGIFASVDGGVNWTHSWVFQNGTAIYSVLLTRSDPSVSGSPMRIYAGGPAGVALGTLPLSNWVSPVLDPGAVGGIQDIHAFSDSPMGWNHAFVVNGARQLFRTEDRGNIWTLMPSAPAGSTNCRGTAFIKSRLLIELNRSFHLYFGNRCTVHHFVAPVSGNTVQYDAGTWEQLDIDHADTRDLAVAPVGPVLLATNGGLHNSADNGHTWRFVGGGDAGYDALQITDIRGQFVGTALPDLYLGTRDNNLWALNVFGFPSAFRPAEGYEIDAERKVASVEESHITYMACVPCRARMSGWRFDHDTAWDNAPGATGAPVLVRSDQYVQNVPATDTLRSGLALKVDNAAWQQYGVFSEEPRGIPTLALRGAGDHSVVYQAFRSNLSGPPFEGATRLMRIQFSQGNGVAVYPAMAGCGGLAMNRAFASYPVLGVDSGNWFHVIAPDIINQRMVETWNGGEDWSEIPGLTSLVTKNGELQFISNVESVDSTAPLVTAVSFCPQDPNLVLIGTSEGGIYYSKDRGATWAKVEGSEKATYITSFWWQNTSTIFISTFGRGLWQLRNRRIAVADAFNDFCGKCNVVSNDGSPDRPPFDNSVLLFDGHVLGVRTEKSQLKEIFVTPGSSALFTGDPQDDLAITETDGKETGEPLPASKDGIAAGVVFMKDGTLTGTAFAASEISLLPPEPTDEPKGSTDSPIKGTPYIRLASSGFNGFATAAPQEVFALSATGFVAGVSYEVVVDGAPIKGDVTADGSGAFNTRITAPSEPGAHSVGVRAKGSEKVMDGSTVVVVN